MNAPAAPKVSFVTVNRNQATGLAKTLDSVRAQTFRDFEHIVIDGGSTDGSADLLRVRADGLAYWVSEPDNGIYNAMNKGLQRASGRWVLFLNGGDRLADHSTLAEVFQQEYSEDVLFGDEIREGKKKTPGYVSVPHGCPFDKLFFAHHTIPHQCCPAKVR